MKSLEDFLALPDISEITEEIELSRLGKLKIKALDSDEYNIYIKKNRKVDRKGNVNFNDNAFKLDIISEKLVEPDFSNPEFLKKAKCNTAKEFINSKLLPGEIQELSDKILELSGFDKDISDDIEEAKN